MHKYLYKLEYLRGRTGCCKFYIGSRKSELPPNEDLLKRYKTSSKVIKKLIKEAGIEAFRIVEIREFENTSNIYHEEAKWLTEVGAKESKEYFNMHNNTGYLDIKKVNRICPWCYTKNYGNPFEKCSSCKEVMIIYYCECGNELKHSCERCSRCNVSKNDNRKYICECGNILKNPSQKCSACGYWIMDNVMYPCKGEGCNEMLDHPNRVCHSCGYSASKYSKYTCSGCGEAIENPSQTCKLCGYEPMKHCNVVCEKCNNKLDYNIQKCSKCGHSKAYNFKYYCRGCGEQLQSQLERCPKCNRFERDYFKFKCKKCKSAIKSSGSRCLVCDYCIHDEIKNICCNKNCQAPLKNSMEICKACGTQRKKIIKCKNCGAEGLDSSSSKCKECGITKAGCDTWKKFNPFYELVLNKEVIFSGFKHQCVAYMEENLISGYTTLKKGKFFEGYELNMLSSSRKYKNKDKYIGLKAILKVQE